jgi:hypothetical protein
MYKKILDYITLMFLLNFLFNCSSIRIPENEQVVKEYSTIEIKTKIFPEIQLKTMGEEIHTGKPLSLKGRIFELLPFPYWNVESVKVDLEEIHSIKLIRKERRAGKGFAGGFAWGFLITGTLAGLSSKYDEDFEEALLGSAIVGGSIGLLGFVIGGFADATTKSEYYFYKMSDSEKIKAIKKIMGYKI